MADVRRSVGVWASRTLLTGIAIAAAMGCGGSAQRLRGYTYPPDFRYIAPHELSTAMGRLALAVDRLDDLLRPGPAGGDALQAQVVGQLRELAGIASELTAGSVGTNHPWLDHNIESFRLDVELARRAATHDPPNYYLAGSIAGACGYCHQRQE